METKKRIFVPLFITFVMVVGAFAAMVHAPGAPAAVGARDPISTRADDGGAISALDAFTEEQEALQPEPTADALDVEPTFEQIADMPDLAQPSGGQITITKVEEGQGSRAPGVDAGGPYGGPSVYEGTTITFTATVDDPSLIFFRWDFNNDGVYETPWRLSLTMSDTISWFFGDDYYGDIVVQAWDGVSTTTIIHSGDNLDEWNSVQWIIYPANIGWRFTAKKDLTITQLGFYTYGYYFSTRRLILWDVNTQSAMRSCTPSFSYYSWRWCSISPVTLTTGDEYVMAIYKRWNYYPYLAGTNWGNIETNNDQIEITDFVYRWSSYGYPGSSGGTQVMPLLDFKWQWIEIVPLAESDTALLEIHNAAPIVYNVQTIPPMAYEGGETSFIGQFEDQGVDDTWEYRWAFGDGTFSDWYTVDKMVGGANVLFATTWSNNGPSVQANFAAECGDFCKTVDFYDWGPLGTNSPPPLDLMLQYDVVIVGTNYIPTSSLANAMGDRLADYCDGGGAVVQMWSSLHTSPRITGRWTADEYNAIERGSLHYGYRSLGTIYVPGHPIMNGVTSLDAYYKHNSYDVTSGATRLADYNDGKVLAGFKTNPVVPNDARIVALAYWPGANVGGDYILMMVNAVRWASQQPDPTPKLQPITTDPVSHVYVDDEPVTTSPSDDVTVTLQVRDDDHGKVLGDFEEVFTEDFQTCYYPSWPSGWYAVPSYGWRCYYSSYLSPASYAAVIWYYYNDYSTSYLYSPSIDLSTKPYGQAQLSFNHYWWANWGGATQDGYIEVSIDGGVTWTAIIEFHHLDPSEETASYTVPMHFAAGEPDVRLRLRFVSGYDWTWHVDNLLLEAAAGEQVWGLGEASGIVTIVNVEPTIHNGPTSGHLFESGIFDFFGYKITDPALWEPTEWFAYKWDFDDGTGSDWIHKGSLAPPQLDILVMHSWDGGQLGIVQPMLESLDLVGTVEYWDFFSTQTAPSLSYMLDFDVLMWASNWAWLYSWWDALKRQMGDAMADYMDLQRGGVVTWMATYDLSSFYGNVFALVGRYIDDDYGAFEAITYPFGDGNLGDIHFPDHPVMKAKYTVESLTSGLIHSGPCPTTTGGLRLASWTDGGAAVGAKELANGMRSVNYGGFGQSSGDIAGLMRNAIAWVYGPYIPNDDIFPMSHQFGDNGVYNVDIMVIDDDMGWTWNLAGNEPVADPMYPQTMTHYIIPITVDNVDPMINSESIEVYIAAEFCLRVAGTEWHQVALTTYMDGVYVDDIVIERQPGDPNEQAKCAMVKVDMMSPHLYSYDVDYIPFQGMNGGSNPSWVIISPWRDPITPGHGTVTYKHDFEVDEPSTWSQSMSLPDLKTDLLDNKHGAEISFEASAFDYGTDDLAFVWVWGDDTPYGMHIHHNNGMPVSEGINTDPENVGFSEPWFDFGANDVRSPHGQTFFVTRDIAHHAFDLGYYYYVILIVMDDDVNDPYPSPYGHAGTDMEFVEVDLR
jgi:hypothetical protein